MIMAEEEIARRGGAKHGPKSDCNAANILVDSLTWGTALNKRAGHGLCPAVDGSRTRKQMKKANDVTDWKAGAAFAYRTPPS